MYIIRPVDRLGRFVIPIDIRKLLRVDVGDELKITVVDGKMVVEKYEEPDDK